MSVDSSKRGLEKLHVAILSSASGGGAGIAARRVCAALDSIPEITADFLDRSSLGVLPQDMAPAGNWSNQYRTNTHFTVEYPGHVRGWVVELLSQYDVINLHWISFLLSVGEIEALCNLGKRIVITMHDYNFITGGCHYPAGCRGNEKGCMACPQIDDRLTSAGVTASNWRSKKRIFDHENVSVVTPSEFLANEAVRSGLVASEQVSVIRNPYFPVKDIEVDASSDPVRVILLADSFSETRKGMPLAVEVLKRAASVAEQKPDARRFQVDIIGQSDAELLARLDGLPVPFHFHGRVTEHGELARLLAGGDVLMTCSYEDNWPNVLVEGAAYGCIPVVGPGHGCEEFVEAFRHGTVSEDYSVAGFSRALNDAIWRARYEKKVDLSNKIRAIHNPKLVARDYEAVFRNARGDAGLRLAQ